MNDDKNNETMVDQEVSPILKWLAETLDQEKKRILKDVSHATNVGDIKTGKVVLGFAEQLENVQDDLSAFITKWDALLRLHRRLPVKAQEIVTGNGNFFTGEINGPSVLRVTFSDKEVIEEKIAAKTFAEVIDKIGAKRVADLGIPVCGEQVVSKKQSKKYPTACYKTGDGYFVLTQSSTKCKKDILEQISDSLGLKLRVEIVARS